LFSKILPSIPGTEVKGKLNDAIKGNIESIDNGDGSSLYAKMNVSYSKDQLTAAYKNLQKSPEGKVWKNVSYEDYLKYIGGQEFADKDRNGNDITTIKFPSYVDLGIENNEQRRSAFNVGAAHALGVDYTNKEFDKYQTWRGVSANQTPGLIKAKGQYDYNLKQQENLLSVQHSWTELRDLDKTKTHTNPSAVAATLEKIGQIAIENNQHDLAVAVLTKVQELKSELGKYSDAVSSPYKAVQETK
jgi:hypothetical protein